MKKFYWLLLFFLGSVNPVFSQEIYQAHTHVRLVSEQDAVVPGGTFWAGLDLAMDDGWHVYWQNPGDSGLSPKIKWDLPSGIKAGDILTLVDNKPLTDSNAMLETISSLPPGKVAVLKLLRNQREVVVQVKVGKRPKPKPQE